MSLENSQDGDNWLVESIALIACLEGTSGEFRRQLLAVAIDLFSTYAVSFAMQPSIAIQVLIVNDAILSQGESQHNFHSVWSDYSEDSDWKLLSKLPGYLSKECQNQSESSPQKIRTFTLEELNQQLQRFITDYWEKESSLKTAEQRQPQRWEPSSRKQFIGLNETFELHRLPVHTRKLFEHRLLKLNHQYYRGEDKLENYIGNVVNVRFDSNDSSVVYVFIQEGDREIFVGNAFLI
jgi:hypothetical protein